MDEKPNILLLNSGGLDSLVVAHLLYQEGYNVYSLFVNYGQTSLKRSLQSATEIAEKYCNLGHEIINVTSNKREHFSTKNMLTSKKGHSNVPFNPYIAITIGITTAVNENIKYIALGIRDDIFRMIDINKWTECWHYIYNDLFAREGIILLKPIYNLPDVKAVYEKALQDGLTIEEMNKTVSCVSESPCGFCSKCTQRIKVGLKAN